MELKQQAKILNKYFPGKFKTPKNISIPVNYKTDMYLIPKFTDYNQAVETALKAVKETRPFYNWREGKLGKEYLKETERKIEGRKSLIDCGDFYLIHAQMGSKYKGKSVENVRKEFSSNEVGLGAYEVACILLINPDVLKRYEDLWVDCPGDEYSYNADGSFSKCPFFYFDGGVLEFDTSDVGSAVAYYGSASWFFPQLNIESRPLDTFDSLNLESRVKKIEDWIRKESNFINPFE